MAIVMNMRVKVTLDVTPTKKPKDLPTELLAMVIAKILAEGRPQEIRVSREKIEVIELMPSDITGRGIEEIRRRILNVAQLVIATDLDVEQVVIRTETIE